MADNDSGALSPAQAAVALSAFFNREGYAATPQQALEHAGTPATEEHQDLGVLRTFRGRLGTFWVSPRGNVVYYAGKSLHAAGKRLSCEEAIALARRFAETHVAEFAARNFEREMPQFDAARAAFRWVEKRREAETAIYPNSVEVVVDLAEGRVVHFNASDLRLARTTPPRLSEEQARARIRAQHQKSAIEEIELMQLPARGGADAVTVWNAQVMTLAPEGPVTVTVIVNADTGEIVQ